MSRRARIIARLAQRPVRGLFERISPDDERNIADVLRTEKAGGILLAIGTVLALVWANSPWSSNYQTVVHTTVGPAALHLDLSLAHWAGDGLLTIFFFVVGLELKREIVAGELRRPSSAALPIVAAIGGMAVPAVLYFVVNLNGGDVVGWATPTATDIAFALAVLAIVGRSLPNALRAFLLTLAVVDDLLAIIVIAFFYSDSIDLLWLGAALIGVTVFWLLARRRINSPWLLVPIALVTWGFMHASGVHATIAGVLLGLVVPGTPDDSEEHCQAAHLEHVIRPISSGFAVPMFALLSAGVPLSLEALGSAARDPVAQGVVLGLVVGKPLGIVGGTWLVSTITKTPLARGLGWRDVAAVGAIGGIGFTVSLLIAGLAFAEGSEQAESARAAVLIASVLAALIGGTSLYIRDRHHTEVARAASS